MKYEHTIYLFCERGDALYRHPLKRPKIYRVQVDAQTGILSAESEHVAIEVLHG